MPVLGSPGCPVALPAAAARGPATGTARPRSGRPVAVRPARAACPAACVLVAAPAARELPAARLVPAQRPKSSAAGVLCPAAAPPAPGLPAMIGPLPAVAVGPHVTAVHGQMNSSPHCLRSCAKVLLSRPGALVTRNPVLCAVP